MISFVQVGVSESERAIAKMREQLKANNEGGRSEQKYTNKQIHTHTETATVRGGKQNKNRVTL